MADQDSAPAAPVPTIEGVRLDVIRTALGESPELHSYFTEPERGFSTAPRKGFFMEWNPRLDDPAYAVTVIDELLKARLIRRRSGVIFEAEYRINKLDRPDGPIFVVTDFATNRARDRVFPWSDEAEAISRFLVSRPLHEGASRIVDVCSGAGTIALDIGARYRNAEVVGVDNNPTATELARFNAKLNGFSNVQFVTGDLLSPFAGNHMDYGIVNTPFSLEPPGVEEFDHSYGGPNGLMVVEKFLRSLGEFPVFDRVYLLTYSPGTSTEPTSLDDLLEQVGPPTYDVKRWHSLADSRVWRVGEHKRFRAPMPLYYMMSRVFDPSRLGADEKDIEHEVDVHTAWHHQFYDAGLTHLHYGVVELERRSHDL